MISDERGVITSPNYPNHYPNNLDCYWTIHRPYDKLELRFDSFLIHQNTFDYVTITEGPFQNADVLLRHYYSNSLPWLLKDYADRWLWFHFHTDVAYTQRGFKAYFSKYLPDA